MLEPEFAIHEEQVNFQCLQENRVTAVTRPPRF
jgi:hypothetical protein